MVDPLFTLTDVRFKHILAIDHLAIAAGRIGCIVGTSGSGKSTLLRLLNRMISPDTGTIRYRGEDITTINAVHLRRRVVMLPQNPIVFDGSVRDNVLAGLQFSGKPPIADDEITRLLDLLELKPTADTRASWLSGGERQRVALARVLAMRPEVLMLDEPTSALDDGTEELVMERVVRGTRDLGIELLMVTHSRAIAQRWGEDVITIADGRVREMRSVVHDG